MDIQEFVSESLSQIVAGIGEAKGQGINPAIQLSAGATIPSNILVTGAGTSQRPVFLAEFDLAVTVTGKDNTTGKAGISIVQVFSAGGEKSSSNETVSVTRIKFSVPIQYK